MAQSVLYTSKKVSDKTIPYLDEKKFFLLANKTCSRRDLFNFALALGISEGLPTELGAKESLIRNERMENERHLYNAVFFSEGLDADESRIDEILNDEAVFSLVEKYAETGFARINDAAHNKTAEVFTQELIKEMNEIYKDFKEEYLD